MRSMYIHNSYLKNGHFHNLLKNKLSEKIEKTLKGKNLEGKFNNDLLLQDTPAACLLLLHNSKLNHFTRYSWLADSKNVSSTNQSTAQMMQDP